MERKIFAPEPGRRNWFKAGILSHIITIEEEME